MRHFSSARSILLLWFTSVAACWAPVSASFVASSSFNKAILYTQQQPLCWRTTRLPRRRRHDHHHHQQQQRRTRLASSSTTATTMSLGPRIAIHEDFEGLKRIHSNPDIFIIENFLNEQACRDLIQRAQQKKLDPSPVAYAGWTDDFKDLVELAVKGPVTWLAILGAWFQTKDDTNASIVELVVHMVQNFALLLILAVTGIAAFTKSRADGLQQLRTSTSTTLDDLSDAESGTAVFVRRTAELFGGDVNDDGDDGASSSSNGNDKDQRALSKQAALFEAPTVIRYEAGQVLAPHYDANRSAQTEDANRGGQTLATLLVYLNNVEQGGLTRFGKLAASSSSSSPLSRGDKDEVNESKLTVQPKLGDALLFFPADAAGTFDERTEHEGCAAVDEKWIARIWRHAGRVPPPFGLDEENLARV